MDDDADKLDGQGEEDAGVDDSLVGMLQRLADAGVTGATLDGLFETHHRASMDDSLDGAVRSALDILDDAARIAEAMVAAGGNPEQVNAELGAFPTPGDPAAANDRLDELAAERQRGLRRDRLRRDLLALCPGYTLDEMRASKGSRAMQETRARALAQLLGEEESPQHKDARDAWPATRPPRSTDLAEWEVRPPGRPEGAAPLLAEILGCSRETIYRRGRRGVALIVTQDL